VRSFRGLLHEGERKEGRNRAPESDVSDGERREEDLQQQMISPGEEFQQHSESVRQKEKDTVRSARPIKRSAQISRRTSCFKMEKSAIKIS
jgi:hypothetical protein